MKTALLIFGLPRFCAELDLFLPRLKNSEIEWIVTMWKNYPQGSIYADENTWRDNLNTPGWNCSTEEEARAYLESRIPAHHTLRHVELIDWNAFPPMKHNYPNRISCVPEHFLRPYWMLKQCDLARQKYGPYDLVVRGRTDIGVDRDIDLNQIHNLLVSEPNRIIFGQNGRQSNFNDLFNIALADTAKTYCETIDYVDEYNLVRGVPMHVELIVSTILRDRGITWGDSEYITSIRSIGRQEGSAFIPDFGRWA